MGAVEGHGGTCHVLENGPDYPSVRRTLRIPMRWQMP